MSNFSSQYVKVNAVESVFSNSQNLTSFMISQNSGKYDLSESTILLNTRITNTQPTPPADADGNTDNINGIYDVGLRFNDAAGTANAESDVQVPTCTLVKNFDMSSSSRGNIEDLREVGCLQNSLKVFANDFETKSSGDSLGGFSNCDGIRGFQSSPYRQLNKLMGGGALPSKEVSHTVRIPLKDISDFCAQADVMDTSKYNDVRLRCEMYFDRLLAFNSRGQDDLIYRPAGFNLGAYDTPAQVDGPNIVNNFTLTVALNTPERDSPFFVGQKVAIECTLTAPDATVVNHTIANDNYFERTINSISYNQNDDRKVTLNFVTGVTVPVNNSTWSNTVIVGRSAGSSTLSIDRVQLELKKVDGPSPDKIEYKTYSLEQDTSLDNTNPNHTKGYTMEAESSEVVIAFPYDVLPRVIPFFYRISIDNKEEMPQNIVRYSPLDYDRIQRGMVNMGMSLECLQLAVSALDGTTQLQPQKAVAGMILQPLPMTGQPKHLQLKTQFTAGQLQSVNLYKSMMKEI